MRPKLSQLVFLLILTALADTRRSRGRSRGSSSSSSSFWTRKNKSSSESQKVVAPKPSAPKEPEIKKQTANVQQSAPPVNRPIGWNVDNSSPNKNIGQSSNFEQKQHVNPAYSSGPGGYPNNPGGLHSNPGGYPQGGVNSNNPGGYPHSNNPSGYPQGGLYSNNPGGYPQSGQYSNNPGGYPNGGQYSNNPHGGAYPNPSGYPQNPGFHQQNPGYPGYNNPGGYPNNMGGYGHHPNNMGGYPQQQTGLMGSFGGNHGYGGYGGYGGYANGLRKSGGFFGKHAFRNVLGGLFVWYLVSGLMSKPYKVYNYYNQPKEERAEITLPANVLTLCNENATSICIPGTTAICTQDGKILCVTTMTSTAPCQNNTGEMCVNSTIPCINDKDPLCQNKTNTDNITTVSLPCFTNMTINGQSSLAANITLPASEDNKFCVTTMAVPDADLPVEEIKSVEDGKNATDVKIDDKTGWDPGNLTAAGYYGRYGSSF